jgi:O-acetylhomoserine (thiol)-lyase
LRDNTKAIFIESVSNPSCVIGDIEAIADIARDAGIPLIVDNTIATPYLFNPIDHGADIVLHSTTKYLNGHGNSMGGAIVESGKFDWAQNDKFPSMTKPDEAYHGLTFFETFGDFGFTMRVRAVALRDFGPALSPTNAFMTLTGIETLPLRMDRHVANADRVATYLEDHSAVAWVSYAGLRSSPSFKNKERYFPKGCGSVFTFGLKGGYDAGIRLVESCNLLSHLANVGDTRSLILHPASTTHRQLTEEQQIAAGAGPDVVRISVGIETADDIIRDLDDALRT